MMTASITVLTLSRHLMILPSITGQESWLFMQCNSLTAPIVNLKSYLVVKLNFSFLIPICFTYKPLDADGKEDQE